MINAEEERRWRELDLNIRWLRKASLSRWEMSQCLKAQKEGAIRTSDARPSQAEQTVSATMEVRQRGGGCLRDRELPGVCGGGPGSRDEANQVGSYRHLGDKCLLFYSFLTWPLCVLDHFPGIPLSSHLASNSGEDYFIEWPMHEAS